MTTQTQKLIKMNAYQFTYETKGYGGGIAVVVAYNKSEAQLLMLDDNWLFDSEIEGVFAVGDPRVITKFIYIE